MLSNYTFSPLKRHGFFQKQLHEKCFCFFFQTRSNLWTESPGDLLPLQHTDSSKFSLFFQAFQRIRRFLVTRFPSWISAAPTSASLRTTASHRAWNLTQLHDFTILFKNTQVLYKWCLQQLNCKTWWWNCINTPICWDRNWSMRSSAVRLSAWSLGLSQAAKTKSSRGQIMRYRYIDLLYGWAG